MSGERWVRGVVLAGVLAVAGCDVAPPPEAAPGPTGVPVRRTPSARVSEAPPASPGGQEACPEGGVRVAEGPGDAAMGLRVAQLHLVNCGTEPYVLEGYPEIRLLDTGHDPVEAAVEHGSAGIATSVTGMDDPPGRVELAPGHTATVGLLWRNLVTDSSVSAELGRFVDVTPRPGATRLRLRLEQPVDLGNTGKLGVGPWKPYAVR
ncbi:DUF4232 domain-containing protein [Streptomyces sp. NPDC058662]|uniref:DUF4232 domain-containing protein n=1 Tax=Streptomyces sp. NPDC058662 TaxID=3346583 RepID=UPI003652D18C